MKIRSFLAAALTAAAVLNIGFIVTTAEELPAGGLIAEITFDELGAGSGSFTATKGGAVTEHGNVEYTESFNGTKALYISEDSAKNYIELQTGILGGADAATVSFWIKPESRWAFMITSVKGSQEYLNEKYIGMLATPSSFTAERYNNSGTRLSSVTAEGIYKDWQYVTAVFSNGGTKLYVNGELKTSDTAKVDLKTIFNDAGVWIGHGNWGEGEGFSGMIDDFRIYNRALSQNEVAALSKEAIEREKNKLIAEKNGPEISTRFYSAENVTYSDTGVTVTLPSKPTEKTTVIANVYSLDDNGKSALSGSYSKEAIDKTVTFEKINPENADVIRFYTYSKSNGLQPLKNSRIFQFHDGETVTVKTTVTNYTQSRREFSYTVNSSPVQTAVLGVMESKEFSRDIKCENGETYIHPTVTDITDPQNPVEYDAGYLPLANIVFPDGAPADSADTTEGVHDPTVFKDPVSGKYYVYSSHNLVFVSDDLINWKKHDYTSQITVPEKAKAFIETNYENTEANGTYWAPDILYKEGDEYPYWFYLSTSCGLGGRNSVISLVKAKSPGLWDGETLDAGVVIASKEEDGYNTNAIDANIYTDTDGKTYIIWGSFWRGIHAAELDADTGFVKGVDYASDASILETCKNFGARIFSTPAGVAGPEGAYTVHNEDTGYTYMFTSYGWLGTNYNIRVARTDKTFAQILADAPHRQFSDHKGRLVGTTFADQAKEGGSLDELWGYKMSGSFQLGDGIEYVGSGHNSVFCDDDGQWYLVQHCRKVADAVAYLQVKKILWTKDGWPVISPMVYAGETEQAIPEQMLLGEWDLSGVGHTIMREGVTDVSKGDAYRGSDLPARSCKIIIRPDGALANGVGSWTYDGDHTVTLTFAKDGDENKYEFYKSGDTMTLFVLTGFDKDRGESAVVMTGVNQDGEASFAKKN